MIPEGKELIPVSCSALSCLLLAGLQDNAQTAPGRVSLLGSRGLDLKRFQVVFETFAVVVTEGHTEYRSWQLGETPKAAHHAFQMMAEGRDLCDHLIALERSTEKPSRPD